MFASQTCNLLSVYNFMIKYLIPSCLGTDFTLMHEFIPTRSRAELKRKFNREEKINETRINEVLVNCSHLG